VQLIHSSKEPKVKLKAIRDPKPRCKLCCQLANKKIK